MPFKLLVLPQVLKMPPKVAQRSQKTKVTRKKGKPAERRCSFCFQTGHKAETCPKLAKTLLSALRGPKVTPRLLELLSKKVPLQVISKLPVSNKSKLRALRKAGQGINTI